MLNPCGTGGSTVVVTETADHVVIAVDGVPTLLPKYKNCNNAQLPAGSSLATCNQLSQVTDFEYTAATRELLIRESNGDVNPVILPKATTSAAGLVELATSADYPAPTNNVDAATPAYVKAAIDAIPDEVNVDDVTYVAATRVLSVIETDGTVHPVTLPLATTTNPGLVELATSADYPDHTNNVDAATPAYVKAAIDDIPDDLLTPLANIATLTAADRGLSLGEVDIPTNRALTVAEMTATNSDRVGVNFRDMQAIYTNRAAEPTAAGVMNANGRPGHALTILSPIPAGGTFAQHTDYNGGMVSLNSSAPGDVFTVPVGQYNGQIFHFGNLSSAGGNNTEVILRAAAPAYFTGVARYSDHVIKNADGTTYTDIIVRIQEDVYLMWAGTRWMVLHHNYQLFRGSNWRENEDGTVELFSIVGGGGVPTNGSAVAIFPVLLADANYAVFTEWLTTLAPGLETTVLWATNQTTTGFTANNTSTVTSGASARCRYHVMGARLDYAALGGVASF